MPNIRVAVGEMPPALEVDTDEWKVLAEKLAATEADVFVINELPFGPWLACHREFDNDRAKQSIEAHDRAMDALDTLGVQHIVGSHLTFNGGTRHNTGFVFTMGKGYQDIYQKRHVPCSPGYYESVWYEPGPGDFPIVEVAGLKLGILLCSDIMFNEHARHFGRAGAQLIAAPRTTPPLAGHQFDTALAMASVVSGCYVASSNRTGRDELGDLFEGRGAVYDPAGQHVAQTHRVSTIACADIDLGFVALKQAFYPCDLPD